MTDPQTPGTDSNDITRAHVAAGLVHFRELQGISQNVAAGKLGMPQYKLHRTENGSRDLTFMEAAHLCEVYEITLQQLKDAIRIYAAEMG